MVLTVGDIRKALAKYSDYTIVADTFGDDFSPLTTCAPLRAKGAMKITEISKKQLFNKNWFKADLNGKKVIKLDYNPEYSNEFWAEFEEAHPYWKPQLEADARRIAKMKPLSYYCSGQLYY